MCKLWTIKSSRLCAISGSRSQWNGEEKKELKHVTSGNCERSKTSYNITVCVCVCAENKTFINYRKWQMPCNAIYRFVKCNKNCRTKYHEMFSFFFRMNYEMENSENYLWSLLCLCKMFKKKMHVHRARPINVFLFCWTRTSQRHHSSIEWRAK